MEKNKHEKKPSFWTSRLALLVLLLVVAVAYLLVGTFAKYLSSSDGSDSARVARIAVSATFIDTEDVGNSRIIYCGSIQDGMTDQEIIDATTVQYSSIRVSNTKIVDGVKYIAETSQKVDVTVSSFEALHEVYGLEMRLIYTDASGNDHVLECAEENISVDENGRNVYTFPDLWTFPVQQEVDANGNMIGLKEQSFTCDLLFFITDNSVQPVDGVQLFVGAVGTQLD